MLRTNSKQARENTRKYILDHFDPEGYTDTPPETWEDVARFILATFEAEKCKYDLRYQAGKISRQELFVDWCSGLPSLLDTCYYYNRSAVDDLGGILEESPEEKARYTEAQAELMLSRMIYMELQRGCK